MRGDKVLADLFEIYYCCVTCLYFVLFYFLWLAGSISFLNKQAV